MSQQASHIKVYIWPWFHSGIMLIPYRSRLHIHQCIWPWFCSGIMHKLLKVLLPLYFICTCALVLFFAQSVSSKEVVSIQINWPIVVLIVQKRQRMTNGHIIIPALGAQGNIAHVADHYIDESCYVPAAMKSETKTSTVGQWGPLELCRGQSGF